VLVYIKKDIDLARAVCEALRARNKTCVADPKGGMVTDSSSKVSTETLVNALIACGVRTVTLVAFGMKMPISQFLPWVAELLPDHGDLMFKKAS